MDFRKIEFGKADAKEEGAEFPELLIKGYFDANGVIDLAVNKSKFLFLGYKGAGKAALSEHIRLVQMDYNCFVNDILLSDFPYKSFSKIISGDSEPEAKLPIAWEWILLVYAINSLTQDEGSTTLLPNELGHTLDALRQIGILPLINIRDFVTKSSKNAFKVNLGAYFGFAFESDSSFNTNDLKFIHLVSFLKELLGSFSTQNKHIIIIDGLDEILTSREVQYQSIAALINQAKELNNYFRNNNIPIKIIILCRTDIFERLPHPNKNKIRQDSAYIFDWFNDSEAYEESNLVKIANLRGNLVFPDIENIFDKFFPKKYERQSIYSGLLNFTRHTPRDFLQLLNNVQKYCKGSSVTNLDIENGLKSYSVYYFLPEIKDELVGYLEYDKIDTLFNLLSTLRKRDFFLREVQAIADGNDDAKHLNLESIFRVLFECSAIGHIVVSRDRSSSLIYFKYRNRNMSFNSRDRIILHKGIWKALNIEF
ncbi:hypothetical protein HMPREF1214_03421 [Bacteroides sp. HPS0048]|uniref:P-loop ATPase, Sll1717 family n=1 Tax=Bacteroides sp. HPS0048 TaxID=1078089 RepID=UPI00037C4BA4|nr:hypothetical protein [Bacteroides sp. HPS0048]EOA56192.1 hypothetical protein HMPREF1214_03421 [Bacteroides sp. HPS0048]